MTVSLQRNALIGYTGFVGKNLLLQTSSFTHLYNSKNFRDMTNEIFDTICCCGVSATKWIANRHPEKDWSNIQILIDVLRTVRCSRFVLISTIDVYDVSDTNNTESHHKGFSTEPYGRHRRKLEEEIQDMFPNVLIVRLPALFGLFLKKNVIFDMLENAQPQIIHLQDRYQFYYIRNLYNDIQRALNEAKTVVNLFPEAVSVHDLREIIKSEYPFPTFVDIHDYQSSCKKIYQCSSDFTWCRIPSSRVLADFRDYLYRFMFWKYYFTVMPLCLTGVLEDNIMVCHSYGLHRFEIAPNHLWGNDWHLRETLSSCIPNSEIVVLHAILYPYQWNIWNDFSETRRFFEAVRSQCDQHLINVHNLTMGSPRNRQRQDNAIYELGIILREYNRLFNSSGIFLNWELNAPSFGTDTFHSIQACRELLDEDPQHASLTLDTGSCVMIGASPLEFWETFRDTIRHIHYSSFDEGVPPPTDLYDKNLVFFKALVLHKYTGYITVEITPRCTVYEYLRIVY